MFVDPIKEGLARGWLHIDASQLGKDAVLEADVCIIGTGAGGGIAADVLSSTGLKVVMIEEGMLKSSTDFRMLEAEAYPTLYQESASRKTADKAINILQGRCVGGTTVVNWTSSFRTPDATLAYWGQRFGLAELSSTAMAPKTNAPSSTIWSPGPTLRMSPFTRSSGATSCSRPPRTTQAWGRVNRATRSRIRLARTSWTTLTRILRKIMPTDSSASIGRPTITSAAPRTKMEMLMKLKTFSRKIWV